MPLLPRWGAENDGPTSAPSGVRSEYPLTWIYRTAKKNDWIDGGKQVVLLSMNERRPQLPITVELTDLEDTGQRMFVSVANRMNWSIVGAKFSGPKRPPNTSWS